MVTLLLDYNGPSNATWTTQHTLLILRHLEQTLVIVTAKVEPVL